MTRTFAKGVRRKGIRWEYDGDGQFPQERYTASDKRYWKRWKRREGKKLLALAIVLLLASPAVAAERAVLKVTSGGGMCSGVAISGNRLITAGHCFNLGDEVEIHWDGTHKGKVIYDDNRLDIAVIQHSMRGVRTYRVAEKTPPPGTPVVSAGFERGQYVQHTGALRRNNFTEHVTVADFRIDHGASGGGLFAGNELIGIASRTGGRYSLWTPLSSIHAALENAQWQPNSKRPTVYAFVRGSRCAACERFKHDEKAGKFRGYNVKIVTWDTPQWDAAERKVIAATGGRPDLVPFFWVEGTRKVIDLPGGTYIDAAGLIQILAKVIGAIIKGIWNDPKPEAIPEPEPEPLEPSPIPPDVSELKTQIKDLITKVKKFEDAGLIGKAAMIPGLKNDVADLKDEGESMVGELMAIKEHTTGQLTLLRENVSEVKEAGTKREKVIAAIKLGKQAVTVAKSDDLRNLLGGLIAALAAVGIAPHVRNPFRKVKPEQKETT